MRQYRAVNSPFAGINNAAAAQQQGLAASGRRPVLGGLLSKPEGAMGMDALAGLEFEGLGGLLGAGQAIGQGLDAPAAAYQGLIPDQDVNMEALNTAGLAMGAGGAATAPSGALRSGLAREAGLSEAQRQARDVLDMRAAGRAGDVTDDMMARADPQYMFDNTPLDMGVRARTDRAQAGGFDTGTPLYRGDDGRLDSFRTGRLARENIGVTTSDSPNVAATYLTKDDSTMYPVVSSAQNRLELDAEGRNWTGVPADASTNRGILSEAIDPENYLDEDNLFDFYNGNNVDWGDGTSTEMAMSNTNNISRAAQDAGFDEVRFANIVDRGGAGRWHTGPANDPQTTVMTANPANIRSRFARFDPEFAHLSNLSAANASPTAGLLASGAQEQDKPLPFMEMLRGLLR
jgi:hypothetical protein